MKSGYQKNKIKKDKSWMDGFKNEKKKKDWISLKSKKKVKK